MAELLSAAKYYFYIRGCFSCSFARFLAIFEGFLQLNQDLIFPINILSKITGIVNTFEKILLPIMTTSSSFALQFNAAISLSLIPWSKTFST